MLTQTLPALERDGLVHRTVYPAVPVRVEYALTPLGQTLREPLKMLTEWSVHHIADVLAAREEYDARAERVSLVPHSPEPVAARHAATGRSREGPAQWRGPLGWPRRAAGIGGHRSGSTTRFVTTPSASTSQVTTSPGTSGGGTRWPALPQISVRQPR
jgi:HxlR-like helix-turn-helix